MEGTYTITKGTVESYKIRHSSGMYWADITLDHNGKAGRIQIASDFGDFQYYWGSCGCEFKQFLTQIGKDYAAGKFGESKWFDLDGTLKGYKEHVCDRRRRDGISAEEAREVWDEIKMLAENCSEHIHEFYRIMDDCENLLKFFDHQPDVSHKISPQFEKFWSMLWPEFIKCIKEEIQIPA